MNQFFAIVDFPNQAHFPNQAPIKLGNRPELNRWIQSENFILGASEGRKKFVWVSIRLKGSVFNPRGCANTFLPYREF